jgi:hypothetical protein
LANTFEFVGGLPPAARGLCCRKRKRSFLKKRTKNLLHVGTRLLHHRGLIFKIFLLLFFKKEVLGWMIEEGDLPP